MVHVSFSPSVPQGHPHPETFRQTPSFVISAGIAYYATLAARSEVYLDGDEQMGYDAQVTSIGSELLPNETQGIGVLVSAKYSVFFLFLRLFLAFTKLVCAIGMKTSCTPLS